jgi:hypothetical protein
MFLSYLSPPGRDNWLLQLDVRHEVWQRRAKYDQRDSFLAAATRNRIDYLQIGENWIDGMACIHNPKVARSIPAPATNLP